MAVPVKHRNDVMRIALEYIAAAKLRARARKVEFGEGSKHEET